MSEPITYAGAGVDTEAGDKAVELMKSAVARTHGPEVLGGIGAFAGLFDASALKDYRRPLLASSTDGVGTKIVIARQLGVHDTIGKDLVAMVVDDIVVCGAKPLVMTDYIACGKVVPERIADIVRGIAEGCEIAGTALVGGETAEHPGVMEPDDYDVAGAAIGVVEADALLGPDRVAAGDVVVAMASSGLHSNGYSLVRRVAEHAGWSLDNHVDDLGRTVGQELLEPTRIYASLCVDLAARFGGLHALSHVTGGGLAANVARIIPAGLAASVARDSWTLPPVFALVQKAGAVPWHDLESTLNMGVGMVAIVAAEDADALVAASAAGGVPAWVLGEITIDDGRIASPDTVRGAKGVTGGAVNLSGAYRLG
ncbi:phosphoribosylformylglycinamidine cyclo-ligase [Demequina capsici]|uniref:Phosphoribosylformylglycinamidine cyclo-ligase n=1 Tax=Demequina capsici TaxID=3075620 RepID=A0AA96F6J5_9MICO|nr:phosphoribosylformylglycinamidine cyclo-ligase [Demequina sp. OYTSA14]WNM24768.1 phosphoribosylformylglycinamidine cyclo-ligase [Demequina sp. OYTSA14]